MTRAGGKRLVAFSVAAIAIAITASLVFWRSYLVADNFHPVLEGRVYRSAQLDPDDLADRIEAYGLRSILNLRGAGDDGRAWHAGERATAEARDVALFDLRLSAERLPSRQSFLALVELLEGAERPLLVHCAHGVDRTGLAAAIARLLDGASLEDAQESFRWRTGHLGSLSSSDLPLLLDQYRGWLERRSRSSTPAEVRAFARNGYIPYFYDADIELLSFPRTIAAGTSGSLKMRVTNKSPEAWRFTNATDTGVHTGIWLRSLDAGVAYEYAMRGPTPDRVLAPGEALVLGAKLPVISRPGRYAVVIDLVDEGVVRFGDMGSTVVEVELEVAALSSEAGPKGCR